jgi:hypothetical protein
MLGDELRQFDVFHGKQFRSGHSEQALCPLVYLDKTASRVDDKYGFRHAFDQSGNGDLPPGM